MARWQVEITGDRFDLEDLPGLFTNPAFRVVEVDGSYFLEASAFEALGTGPEVHAAARRLVTRINGIARLRNASFRAVEIGAHVKEDPDDGDPRQHAVILASAVEVRAKVGAVIVKTGEQEPRPPPPGSQPTDRWQQAAASDPDVQEVIALWSGPHDWVHLYKMYEIVRNRADIVQAGWATSRELTLFKRTANHQDAAGAEARHARQHQQPPAVPMPLHQAEDLIGRILRSWLDALV
jgi:hypothetical protein